MDIEIIEAESEIDLKNQVREFVGDNAGRVTDISYDTYTDYDNQQLVYIASIFLKN